MMQSFSLSFALSCFLSLLWFSQGSKQGVCFDFAHSCTLMDNLQGSTWYYDWSRKGAFSDSFCTTPDVSLDRTLVELGMEYVPMFWSYVPPLDQIDSETNDMLIQAEYILTFNEPELSEQSNLTPLQAAEQWPNVEAIADADTYNVTIVGPCVTQDLGLNWYDEWTAQCINLYGSPCRYDHMCLHLYYQPYPCGVDDESWSCIGNGAGVAKWKLSQWYDLYQKPIWVTEYACAPWGSSKGCTPEEQMAIMEQLTPVLENDINVFRYSWFALQTTDREWPGNSLNEDVWDEHRGFGCLNRKWVGGFGTDASWKIQTKQQCLQAAESDPECHEKVSLIMDDDNCYCGTDECEELEPTYQWMMTYKQIRENRDDVVELSTIGKVYEYYSASLGDYCVTLDEAACNQEKFCYWEVFGCAAYSYDGGPVPTPAPSSTPSESSQPSVTPSGSTQPSSSPSTSPSTSVTPSLRPSVSPSVSTQPSSSPSISPSTSSSPSTSPSVSPTNTQCNEFCGNGICEKGETCECADCKGQVGGKRGDRFCCVGGSEIPEFQYSSIAVLCSDTRCSENECKVESCNDGPSPPGEPSSWPSAAPSDSGGPPGEPSSWPSATPTDSNSFCIIEGDNCKNQEGLCCEGLTCKQAPRGKKLMCQT